jgi:hypothetical protein
MGRLPGNETNAKVMTHWKHKIELDARSLAPDVVAGQLAEKLLELPAKYRAREDGTTTLDDIAGWLTDAAKGVFVVADDAEDNANGILRELYDWADTNRLWVSIRTA